MTIDKTAVFWCVVLVVLAGAQNQSQQTHLEPVLYKSDRAPLPKSKYDWRTAMNAAMLPPKQFDHDYDGEMKLYRVDMDTVRFRCGNKPGPILGCTQRFGFGYCNVYIVDDDTLVNWAYTYDTIYRHERGHCNGWRHGVND